MFDVGMGEIALILLIVLMFYGPDRLPELARKVGTIVRRMRKISNEIRWAVEREMNRPEPSEEKKQIEQPPVESHEPKP